MRPAVHASARSAGATPCQQRRATPRVRAGFPAGPRPAASSLLLTGRTHQVRVHAAHAGAPLVGDRTYGGPVRVASATGRVHEPGRIALHALRVAVPGPGAEPLVAVAPVPAGMAELWSSLGGAGDAWELASSWVFAPS